MRLGREMVDPGCWRLVRIYEITKTQYLRLHRTPLQLLIILAAGAAAGVPAGLRPARRAARLEMMQALAAE
jgi:putative ABC transport system permease protein